MNVVFWFVTNVSSKTIDRCVDVITVIHVISCMRWFENKPSPQEWFNELIKFLVKMSRNVQRNFVLWSHVPIFFIWTRAIHVVEYSFEITIDYSPFIFTCCPIPFIHGIVICHDRNIYLSLCFTIWWQQFQNCSQVHLVERSHSWLFGSRTWEERPRGELAAALGWC